MARRRGAMAKRTTKREAERERLFLSIVWRPVRNLFPDWYFENKLADWTWAFVPSTLLGSRGEHWRSKRRIHGIALLEIRSIAINKEKFEGCDLLEDELFRCVFLHECVHAYLGRGGHDRAFRDKIRELV